MVGLFAWRATEVRTVKLLKENNQRVRWLSEAEESRLMAVLPKKYRPMVIVSLNTGLRKSEQLNLQWRDIDFRQGFDPGEELKAWRFPVSL